MLNQCRLVAGTLKKIFLQNKIKMFSIKKIHFKGQPARCCPFFELQWVKTHKKVALMLKGCKISDWLINWYYHWFQEGCSRLSSMISQQSLLNIDIVIHLPWAVWTRMVDLSPWSECLEPSHKYRKSNWALYPQKLPLCSGYVSEWQLFV